MIAVISGYFDPLHKGHLAYIAEAREYGNEVWCIVNNDEQCELKKGKFFMEEDERIKILSNIKNIDRTFLSIDNNRTVCETLRNIVKSNPQEQIIFFNAGDVDECKEEEVCKELGIKCIYGMGEKIQSSSKLTGLKEK